MLFFVPSGKQEAQRGLKAKERELKAFLDEKQRGREREREQVDGFTRSEAHKAVWAEKRVAKEQEERYNKRVEDFRKTIADGSQSLKLRKQKQREHIQGDKKWLERLKASVPERRSLPSAFYRDVDIQRLIAECAGKGTIYYPDPKRELPIEYVDAGGTVGIYFTLVKGRYVSTHRFAIVYGKKGVHAYPVKESD